MFGLGMPEILMILAIALIVIGPKKLPELAKTLGRAMGEFKRSAQDFKRSIDLDTTLQDIDPPVEDIKKNFKEANEAAKKDQAGKSEKYRADDTDTDEPTTSDDAEPVGQDTKGQSDTDADFDSPGSETEPRASQENASDPKEGSDR
ncbi:MAG: twin-arginine translocase TatA/TatE family subunit [Desulfobacteraceae bacterium]|nr:MAG: twin-arginine translocase TatA/TatE family subunit [Desulfobacteraceae bacterium]